ncbi:MAG TPA: HEXXH motif-containing putative peptide modification protein [Pyrinomonadaceae bacterium]|jgi:HEXXH motif-containing protein|nr:HEXXH motif-containing putative peptide modification protein [Pyrinomonadaceae bacterium]
MSGEEKPLIDLGPGHAWAYPRGVDDAYSRLIRFISNLTLAEFTTVIRLLEEGLPNKQDRVQLRACLNSLQKLPPKIVNRVLTHPLWIYWVRSTGQIICAMNAKIPVASQWRGHLHPDTSSAAECLRSTAAMLSQLVLACHIVAGHEVEIEIQTIRDRYLALPGTGLSYVLPGGFKNDRAFVTVSGYSGSTNTFQMHLRANGGFVDRVLFSLTGELVEPVRDSDEEPINWLRVVKSSGGALEIDNRDNRYLSNWVKCEAYPEGTQVDPVPDSVVPAWCEDVPAALHVLGECLPLMQAEISSLIRSLVPVMSSNLDHSVSCSTRDFLGAVQLSAHPGIALAEVLVHEYRHNILNAIIDVDPILDESSPRRAAFYSPWRKDPRPLMGLIHGIYSFMEVVGFYESYLGHYGSEAPQAALAEERIVTNSYRLKIAVADFTHYAKLTRFGVELLDGIQQRVEQFQRHAECLNAALWKSVVHQVDQERRSAC